MLLAVSTTVTVDVWKNRNKNTTRGRRLQWLIRGRNGEDSVPDGQKTQTPVTLTFRNFSPSLVTRTRTAASSLDFFSAAQTQKTVNNVCLSL